MSNTDRCPECGYTEEDKRIHRDHHLCKCDPEYTPPTHQHVWDFHMHVNVPAEEAAAFMETIPKDVMSGPGRLLVTRNPDGSCTLDIVLDDEEEGT